MIGDLCTIADAKDWLSIGKMSESHAVAASVTVNQAKIFQANNFVSVNGIPFTQITTGVPTQGEYSVSAGVYTFNALDSGNAMIMYMIAHQDDGILTRLITAASEDIRQECSRRFDIEAYDEFYNGAGWGHGVLITRQWPIVSIQALIIDNRTIPAQPAPGMPGYTFTNNDSASHVTLYGYEFTRGTDNIELQYNAGYATIPADLNQACIELVGYRYSGKSRIGHKSKSLQGETVSFITAHMPDFVLRPVQRYRRVTPT